VRVAVIACLIFAVSVSGCGYSLQGRSDLPFESVSLGAIENSTTEPKLQDRMSRLLAETLMEYGVDISRSAMYRIEGAISTFTLTPISEKSLSAIEYQITVVGKFYLVDVQTQRREPLMNVASPFITYFRSSGALVSVIAQKEAATESALKDLSQELVRRIIYKKPAEKLISPGSGGGATEKKGEQRIEPQTVPAGR